MTVVAKSKNYAAWYLQQRASEQLQQAIQQCGLAGLEPHEVLAIAEIYLGLKDEAS